MRSTMFRRCLTAAVALAAWVTADAAPSGISISTVSDPVDDTLFIFNAPYQDFVFGQLTKTADGDFEFLMELAAPIPASPSLSPPGRSEIWWFWIFDLDPATGPKGYPWKESADVGNAHGKPQGRPPEFIVCVSWDGVNFAGNAIDRRPLLTGGEAIITPVPFSINGTTVEAFLPSEVIGALPANFRWGPFTMDWSGPVGSEGCNFADYLEGGTVFNP